MGSGLGSSDGDDFSHTRPTKGTPPPKALRNEISHLREKVIMARLELRESRVGMRQQHALVRSLETRLLKTWQRSDGSTDHDAVGHLHAELCLALDKLGPMEQDYDEREDGLDTLEFDLEAKEARFYKQHTEAAPAESDERLPMRPSSTSTLSDELEEDFLSPQYQYYSRIGDAKIARERLMDLEAQKDQYLDIERERDALGIPLYQENIDFLSRYDSEYAEHQEELEKIERDIQSLEIQAGLSNAKDAVDTVTFHDPGWDVEANISNRQSSPVSEPGQAGPSGHSLEEYPRRKSENDIRHLPNDTWSSRDRINQWILERLENSPIEQARHKAELNRPDLDSEAWWSLVCQFWQLDRAARLSESSSPHGSGGSISAKARKLGRSVDVDLNEASIALQITTQAPSATHEAVLAEYAEQDMSELDYLDLAAGPLAKT
ncbi:MAG: hypothetical protein Q9221_007083, partial [Calogaya cf. arnoldii]